MLWYKSWLETRVRLLVALGMLSFFLMVQYQNRLASQRSFLMVAQSEWPAIGAASLAGRG